MQGVNSINDGLNFFLFPSVLFLLKNIRIKYFFMANLFVIHQIVYQQNDRVPFYIINLNITNIVQKTRFLIILVRNLIIRH